MKRLLMFVTLILALIPAFAAAQGGNEILGNWNTENGKAVVNIHQCGDRFCGAIVSLAEPNNPDGSQKLDKNNPDPGRQSRTIVGINIVWGFSYDGEGKYSGGSIYDPENGKTYHCNMTLNGNSLDVRGSLTRAGFLGRTTTWTR